MCQARGHSRVIFSTSDNIFLKLVHNPLNQPCPHYTVSFRCDQLSYHIQLMETRIVPRSYFQFYCLIFLFICFGFTIFSFLLVCFYFLLSHRFNLVALNAKERLTTTYPLPKRIKTPPPYFKMSLEFAGDQNQRTSCQLARKISRNNRHHIFSTVTTSVSSYICYTKETRILCYFVKDTRI